MTHLPMQAVVVGTGFIGPVHVEALRRAGVQVAGIVGSTPDKSRAAASELGLPNIFETFDDVLRSETVDAVHLTTPNRLHFQQAAAALLAGKHVVCEKPLAMSTQESAELVRMARESKRAAAVAYNIRFYPLCHEAAARMHAASIGPVLHINGSYVQDWLLRDTDFNWRVLASEGGELRAVADIGTHWLDLVQFITGLKVVSVFADLRTVHPLRKRPPSDVQTFSDQPAAGSTNDAAESDIALVIDTPIDTEDCGSVLLRFDNGANGCLWTSQTTAGRKNCLRFEIGASNGSLAWDSEAPNSLWIGHRDRPNETLLRDPSLMSKSAANTASYPGGHNEGFPDTFKQLFTAFYRYIETGDLAAKAPFPTFDDGHHEVALCEAILKSHRSQQWAAVAE